MEGNSKLKVKMACSRIRDFRVDAATFRVDAGNLNWMLRVVRFKVGKIGRKLERVFLFSTSGKYWTEIQRLCDEN